MTIFRAIKNWLQPPRKPHPVSYGKDGAILYSDGTCECPHDCATDEDCEFEDTIAKHFR